MIKKNIKLIIISLIILIIITIGIYLLSYSKNSTNKIDSTKVSTINDNNDPTIRDIYHQFNPEEGILFNIIGSNNSNKYYSYYYKNNKLNYKDLDDIIKTYLTIQSIDYKNYPLENNCYNIGIQDLNITYSKLFPDNNLNIQTLNKSNPNIELTKESICIEDNITNNYNKTIDTQFVNATYQNNQLIIYERVAFINITDNNIEFYSDYNMKNKVYSIEKTAIDLSFINNQNIVSNVLINNKNKFNIYTYTFDKNKDHYNFKSIEK